MEEDAAGVLNGAFSLDSFSNFVYSTITLGVQLGFACKSFRTKKEPVRTLIHIRVSLFSFNIRGRVKIKSSN